MVYNGFLWKLNELMDSAGNRQRKAVFASGMPDSPLVSFLFETFML